MKDLLASNESVFHGLKVLSVEEEEKELSITTRFVATAGKWFSPACEDADAEGWVTGEGQTVGELTFHLDDKTTYDRFVANLVRWRENKTELHGIFSEKTSTLGFYDPRQAMSPKHATLIQLETIASNN